MNLNSETQIESLVMQMFSDLSIYVYDGDEPLFPAVKKSAHLLTCTSKSPDNAHIGLGMNEQATE